MLAQKFPPRRIPTPLRRRLDSVVFQNLNDYAAGILVAGCVDSAKSDSHLSALVVVEAFE